ncbi:MAG: hypothetical protein KA204_00315 [Chromatiaceae bacterium]|nr:hypothetical protein [Chromatiaceae bacterium]MBP6733847.1 hypothetical protein [Chromatiaceae bacterium]MBP6807074.1 hypothetical protein [Chromatiaceae bacterium]
MAIPRNVAIATNDLAELEAQLTAPVAPEEDLPEPPDAPTDPAPEHPEPPAPVAPPDVPATDPEEKWESRYRHLQGKYDAELPRLHAQIKELHAILAQRPEPQAPPQQAEPERYVTDEDVANYGDDYIDVHRRITLDTVRDLKTELATLKAQLERTGEQVGTVSFETKLAQAVPDFETINSNPEWVGWLNEVDPILRGPRRLVAQAAYARGDVEAVKAYVDLWKQLHAQPVTEPKADRQQELRRQVQPSRTTASAPATSAKLYSMAQATEVFDKMQRLVAQGRIEEANRLDAEISAAYNEGRVIA